MKNSVMLGVGTLVVLSALVWRVLTEGEGFMVSSDQAFDRGDLTVATEFARRAAIAYAPGAPHPALAFERLRAIALGSEAKGDVVTAQSAWRAIRAAALETRHLWTPYAANLDLANRQLARLAVPGADPELTARQRAGVLRGLADDDTRGLKPLVWAAVLSVGGLLAWGLVGWRG